MLNTTKPSEAQVADRISAADLEQRLETLQSAWSMGHDDPGQLEHETPAGNC